MAEGRNIARGHENNSGASIQQGSYVYTEDERRVMQECRTESFYYRCVPFTVLLVGTSQIFVNKGILRPHPRFGALFKNMGAGFLGYILGKASYLGACREKILQLENSPIANNIRRSKSSTSLDPTVVNVTREDPAVQQDTKLTSDYKYDEIDTDHKQIKGLDDNFRPNIDSDSDRAPVHNQGNASTVKNYEDLRQQNRDQHDKKLNTNQGHSASQHYQAPVKSSAESKSSEPVKRLKRNQYGDVIEE